MHGRAPGLHHRPPVGLLVVADPDHEHLALEVEQPAGERQRGAPLAGAGLGGELADPLALVVVGLGDGGVRLVRAGRRDRPRTCSRCARACRARAPGAARDRAASGATACRSRAPRRGSRSRAPPRPPARSAPSGRSAPGRRGPSGSWVRRVKRRRGRPRQVRQQVHPVCRDLGLGQQVLGRLAHLNLRSPSCRDFKLARSSPVISISIYRPLRAAKITLGRRSAGDTEPHRHVERRPGRAARTRISRSGSTAS